MHAALDINHLNVLAFRPTSRPGACSSTILKSRSDIVFAAEFSESLHESAELTLHRHSHTFFPLQRRGLSLPCACVIADVQSDVELEHPRGMSFNGKGMNAPFQSEYNAEISQPAKRLRLCSLLKVHTAILLNRRMSASEVGY